MDSTDTKVCKACGEWKPLSEYGPCKKSKDRLEYRCRSCVRAYKNARNAEGKRNIPRRELSCGHCGKRFMPPRVGPAVQKYCSRGCAQAINRANREQIDAIGVLKQCRACGEWRARVHFQREDNCVDGRKHVCCTCDVAGKKRLRASGVVVARDSKQCTRCGITYPATADYWHTNPQMADGLKSECKNCLRVRGHEYYLSLPPGAHYSYDPAQRQAQRFAVLQHYGGSIPKCACCGVDIPAFLTIDHIAGNGKEHRAAMRGGARGAGSEIYRWLRNQDYPPGFQVLCFSCNAGKGTGDKCVHQLPPPDLATMSYNNRYLYRLRREVMTHYGNGVCACTCCGEETLRLLTIDHIDGGGRQHFKELGIIGGGSFWRWLRAQGYPPGYRTTCYNCNLGNGVYRRFGEWERCPAHEQRSPHPPHAAES